MKPIKFLFSVSLLYLFPIAGKAQTFFKDSTVWYGYNTGMSVANGEGGAYFLGIKDSIHLDSITIAGEFYQVYRYAQPYLIVPKNDWLHLEKAYKLRVKDRKVYYTGNYFNPDSNFLNDKLVYDFTKKVGDTFTVWLGGDKYFFNIDSIKNIQYEDSVMRPTFYSQVGYEIGPHIEGLGSTNGLIYFNRIVKDMQGLTFMPPGLITVCNNGNLLYKHEHWFETYKGQIPTCDPDTIRKYLLEATIASVKEFGNSSRAKIYPNPVRVSEPIGLTNCNNCSIVMVTDLLGRNILHFQQMDNNTAPGIPGVYFVQIKTRSGILFNQKLIVVE